METPGDTVPGPGPASGGERATAPGAAADLPGHTSAATRFESLWEAAPDALVEVDRAGTIRFVNRQTELLFGYGRDELVGEPIETLIPDSFRPRHPAHREGYLADPRTRAMGADLLLSARRRDGSEFPVDIALSSIETAEGLLVTAAVRDITAQRQAETDLAESGRRYRLLAENSADFVAQASPDGVLTWVSSSVTRSIGWTPQELVGTTVADKIHPDDMDTMATTRALVYSGHEVTAPTGGFVMRMRTKSGDWRWMSELPTLVLDETGVNRGVVVSLRDVDDLVQGSKEGEAAQALLDQQLADQQFYTRSLIESNVDALTTTDPQGIITDVNQQMMTLTGRTRAELIGAPFRDFFTDPALADAAVARVLAERKVSDYELTVRARGGEETYVSFNATTIHDRRGSLLGVFAAARDVTDRRSIERALLEKNVELERANRMKSEFLATMSHELRTPLNSVIGFSEALRDGLMGALTESQAEYVGDIFTSGQHLLSLINDILDLSKVEAGMMDLELEEVDVRLLLAGSLSIVRDNAAAGHIGLDLELTEDLGVARLDTRKTKQIVYNLLSNAVKFCEAGGRVSLRARRVPRASVGTLDAGGPDGAWPVRSFALAADEFSDFVEIRVTDAGIGISRQNLAKLFEPFTQIDSGLARRFEGTGLGLAMVKQMTELLGGTVAVASRPGEGTCFAAWIPLRTGARPAGVERHPEQGTEHSTELHAVGADAARVPEPRELVALVVEDDDGAADLVRLLLEAEAFTVLRARSAEEALELGPQQGLDLITLDIRLPGVDGWEFLARIRQDAGLRAVPVVIVSGTSHGQLVALDAGASAVLQKPISRAALKGALADLGFHDAQARTCTVLVVDDDPQAVELTAAYLPGPAYATVRAYGGQEAIVLAHRVLPDLIVLDLMMPDVDGFDVVHALKSDVSTAGIPILVVTAKDLTAPDRQVLTGDPSRTVRILEKAGVNRANFMAEVRHALSPH